MTPYQSLVHQFVASEPNNGWTPERVYTRLQVKDLDAWVPTELEHIGVTQLIVNIFDRMNEGQQESCLWELIRNKEAFRAATLRECASAVNDEAVRQSEQYDVVQHIGDDKVRSEHGPK